MYCSPNYATEYYDKHHIVPRHAGGSDDFTNIVKCSRACHAIWHYCNFQLYKKPEDLMAYKGLGKQAANIDAVMYKSKTNGLNSHKNKTGIHGLSKQEKIEASSRGGKKASTYMGASKWINNGQINKRVLASEELPLGFILGKIKKPKEIIEFKESNRYKLITEKRIKDLENFDLSEYGCISKLAKLWAISTTQVRRFLSEHGYSWNIRKRTK